jgi:tape measure domain-containing protein
MKVADIFAELGIEVDLAAFAAADARLAQTEAHAALFTERMRSKTRDAADASAQAAQMIGLDADSAIAAMQEKSIARAKRWKSGITSAVRGVAIAAFAGFAFVQAIKGVAGLGDSYNAAASKVRMLTDDTEKQIEINDRLFASAQETATSFGAVTSLYQQVGKAAVDNGKTLEQGVAIVDTINKAIKAGGTPGAGAEAALTQLSQGLGSGKLRGEEFNSVIEQAPFLIDIIAKDLGKTRGEMKALANAGKLTSKVVLGALEHQKEAVDEAFAKRIPLITDEFTRMRNEIEKTFGELLQDKEVATAFQSALRGLTRGIILVVRGFAAATVFFSRHQKIFLALLSGLTAAFLVLMYQAGATWLAIAGPVALAVAAIALFVVYFEDMVNFVAEGTLTMLEALDSVAQKILSIPRRIRRGFEAVGQFFRGIAQSIRDTIASVIRWVTDKIDWVIDRMNWAIRQLNRLPGVEVGTIGHVGAAPARSVAPAARNVSVGPTTVNVTSTKADPVAVGEQVKGMVAEHWNERMRETAEGVAP